MDSASDALAPKARRLRTLFDRDARLTKREIADEVGCDPRHALRLVNALRAAGVPVAEEKDPHHLRAKRFFLPVEHQRRGLVLETLDEEALLALTVAAEAAEAALAGTPLEAPLRRGFGALLAATADLEAADELLSFDPETEAAHWHFGTLRTEPPDPEVFTPLTQAKRRSQCLRMDYVNKDGERSFGREVDPLLVAPIRGRWYLIAYCHTRRALRDFTLARISNVRPVERYFAPPEGFDAQAFFAKRFGLLEGGAPVEVRLRVGPERAVYFRSHRYHPSQAVEEQEDGSLEVTYRAPSGDGLDEVRAFVASWGPPVLALEPPELAERLADDAAETVRAYQGLP